MYSEYTSIQQYKLSSSAKVEGLLRLVRILMS